jgi:putative heme-binding domain-containing protein
VTTDGKVVSGLLIKETVDKMYLSSAEGVVQSVPYREIEEARYSDTSLMPEGVDKLLKPEEIADIVAYLKASKPPTGNLYEETE